MFHYFITLLLATAASVFGNNTQGLIAGDVSPAPKNAAAASEEDADDTGEVDNDIIIDEENEDDDEDVQN